MPRKIKGNWYKTPSGDVGEAVEVHRKPNRVWPSATSDDPIIVLRERSGLYTGGRLSRLSPVPTPTV